MAQDRWKVTAQSLAFKGSGYFGLTAKEVRKILDLAGILAAAKRSGMEHFLLERDQTPTPDEALRKSYRYLASLELK